MKKFPKFVFWNIFRLEATTDEIDVNTVPSFDENESHVPRRRAKLLTFFQKKKVVGTTRVDRASRTFTPFSRLQVPPPPTTIRTPVKFDFEQEGLLL